MLACRLASRRPFLPLLGLVIALMAACGGDQGPKLTGPASIEPLSSVVATAPVASAVAPAPVFVVQDSAGYPLPNVLVTFSTFDGATVMPAQVATDASGHASPSSWSLGTHTGTYVLRAEVPGLPTAEVRADATAGAPSRLTMASSRTAMGINDVATLSGAVTDVYGNPIPFSISFTSSDPSVLSISGTTAAAHRPGSAVITATAGSLSRTLTITVNERIGGLTGRPFGIAYVGGTAPYVLVSSLDVARVFRVDLSTYAVARQIEVAATPADVAVASNDRAYVSAVDAPVVAVIDPTTGAREQDLPMPYGSTRLVLSTDAQRLYVAGHGYVVRLNTATDAVSGMATFSGSINGLAVNAAEDLIWASSTGNGKVYRLEAGTFTVLDSAAVGGVPQAVLLDEANGRLYVANESGWIDVLDAATLDSIHRIEGIGMAFGLAASANGGTLYATGSFSSRLYSIDTASWAVTSRDVGGVPRRLVVLPDGTRLVANEGGWVDIVH